MANCRIKRFNRPLKTRLEQFSMDVWWTYSLQDFLLFSKQTWLVLFADFSGNWWFMAVILLPLQLLLFSRALNDKLSGWLKLICNLATYLSCVVYYWIFYLQINQYAPYFAALMLLQMLVNLLLDVRALNKQQHTWSLFTNPQNNRFAFVLAGCGSLVLAVSIVLLSLYNSPSVWLLPGLHPSVSLSLLLLTWKVHGRYSLWLALLPCTIVTAEVATLYALDVAFWWGLLLPLCFFCAPRLKRAEF